MLPKRDTLWTDSLLLESGAPTRLRFVLYHTVRDAPWQGLRIGGQKPMTGKERSV